MSELFWKQDFFSMLWSSLATLTKILAPSVATLPCIDKILNDTLKVFCVADFGVHLGSCSICEAAFICSFCLSKSSSMRGIFEPLQSLDKNSSNITLVTWNVGNNRSYNYPTTCKKCSQINWPWWVCLMLVLVYSSSLSCCGVVE